MNLLAKNLLAKNLLTQNLMAETKVAFIGLGANLGDRFGNLSDAIRKFDQHNSIEVLAVSKLYQTKAHTLDPTEKAPDYFNAAIKVETSLGSDDLLQFCLEMEKSAGRRRKNIPQWAPRTLDLDILWVQGVSSDKKNLILPHPRLHLRKFVLLPLADLSEHEIITHNQTVPELLKNCPDPDMPKVVSDTTLLHSWPPISS